MTAASPWSVKGIDPKAREVAKDLARRSGMTLGEWLNRMIIEGDGQPGDQRAGDETPTPPNRAYLEIVKDNAPPRIEVAEHPADEVGRVAVALDRLTQRIEAAEGRNAAAITGIDHSVREALSRLGQSEREQIAVAARFEGAVNELKTEQARGAERVRRIETEAAGPRSAEALRALEGALGKVAGHLYEGEARTRETIAALEARLTEQAAAASTPQDPAALVDAVVARLSERLEAAETRTSDALRELGSSFSALDTRLGAVEGANPAAGVQERLDTLAASLTQRMEAARIEMAAKLRESADGRFDRMERKLGEMAAHVQAAEQRSAQAIERMGREVVGVADAFNRRVHAAEQRNATAIEQVGGEVARIAATVEHKLNRADSVQAQALEKLGGEIARITEKLAERIGSAERRNALAIDDVGEQVARVTDRLNQRHERSSQELVDRIRQSEERTLRMLEEAQQKIDTRLSEAQRKLEEPAPAPAPARAAAPPPAASPFGDDAYDFGQAASFSQSSSFSHAVADDDFDAPPPPAQPQSQMSRGYEVAEFPVEEPEAPSFAQEDFTMADGFAPEAPRYEPEPELSDFAAPEAPARPMSTRDIIEQARAAARAAATSDAKGAGKARPEKRGKEKGEKSGSLFSGLSFAAKKPKRLGATVATAVTVFGAAGALGAGVGGLLLLNTDGSGAAPTRVAAAIAGRNADVEINGPEADTTPGAPRAAVALSAGQATPVEGEAAAPAATDASKALFEDGVRKIEAGDRSGVEILRRAANGGYPAAQFYLSKMFESGKGGVKQDMPEARRWSERAANGGDPRAMHNLALYYFKGEGGARNSTTAATWFRKAADLGLVDSQFNLAQLYESGLGVSQNPAEAYKWYVIAGRAGDATARSRATALRAQLTAEAQQTADRSAQAFRPQAQVQTASLSAAAAPAATNANLGLAQRVLSQLGYYQGPRDGVSSPALRMAISAYQRDQGLPASGNIDGETLNRLSVYAR